MNQMSERPFTPISPCARVAVLEIEAALETVAARWTALHRARPDRRLGASPDWVACAWREVVKPTRARGVALLGWDRDGLAAVLPLAIERRSLWIVARPLAASSSEYADVLTRPGPQAQAWTAKVVDTLAAATLADVVELPNVHGDSALAAVLATRPTHVLNTQPAPRLTAPDRDWARVESGIGKSFRAGLRRKRRRLEEQGRLSVEFVKEPGRADQLLDWMLRNKAAWMAAGGLTNAWLHTETYRRFLSRAFSTFAEYDAQHLMVLTLAGRPIAAQLNNVSGAGVENLMAAFDPAFAQWSPGQVLQEAALRWAVEQGLSYDFRPGDEPYKTLWASDVADVRTYRAPLNRWGALLVAKEAAKVRLRFRGGRRWRALPRRWDQSPSAA